ncbi:MAG: hypothetical protein ACK5YA_01135, partial [bacterium]
MKPHIRNSNTEKSTLSKTLDSFYKLKAVCNQNINNITKSKKKENKLGFNSYTNINEHKVQGLLVNNNTEETNNESDNVFRNKFQFHTNRRKPDINDFANYMRFTLLSQLHSNFKIYDPKVKEKNETKENYKIKPAVYLDYLK